MKREDIKMLLQVMAAGFLFVLTVPAVMVFFFGEMGSGNHVLPGKQTDFPNKIETPDTIRVWLEDKEKAVTVDFEEYVCRVVASEMPHTFEEEALRAQSVAARTYAMAKVIGYEESRSKTHPEAPVCSSTHCQVYKTEKALIKAHEDGWEDTGWKKIQKACKKTEGELLYYKGELVTQPLFFSSSGGQTENSEDVFVGAYPYLVSVESPHEEEATHKDEEMKVEIGDFAGRVRSAYPQRSIGTVDKSTIKIISRTAGGRVSKMKIGSGEDGALTGTEIRNVMGLSSALFSIRFEGDNIVFTSSGSGHGVGMSQYGANGMAKEGYTYREILHHYYSGTEVG